MLKEGLSSCMRRLPERWRERFGPEIPAVDPESLPTAAIRAGLTRRVGDDSAPTG